ncbi:efflux RND transporter periplasmic adaptor subunit [Candidatus Endoriftia persephonae]|uniref:Efflux RND transporter periplasmic adaptor subunit n=2 Tax=Gammaproteobacteria TaxID=1236 RepID=A0A9J6ZXB4_9GAMM|nr:efflux RND transporter periplasmic adaptor subunit [Candidatus Endoriftia persephone]EGW54241.1 putative RND efflux membrane fusion protein [endosymbiont of Tevnia jerichonana (vent Tica)]USF87460.1 efflux RND transporter periplasmic adaptor subunit [Candidatus Endoriftia persephone]
MASVRRRFLLTLLILVLTIVAVFGLVKTRPRPQAEFSAVVLSRVEVIEAVQRALQPQLQLTGMLQPWQLARLGFEVKGELLERRVEPGQRVRQGELLLRLDDADYRDALTEARAQLRETRAGIERDQRLLKLAQQQRQLAEREFKRLERLGQDSLASGSTRDSARQQLLKLESDAVRLSFGIDSGTARLAKQQAAAARAERNLQRSQLLAPFDGRVNRVEVEVGDYLQPASLVVELIRDDYLELSLEVSTDIAAVLRLGQSLAVELPDGPRQAELVALQPVPDARTHTHPIRLKLPGAGLLPGMLGRVALPLRSYSDAILVPVSALLREAGQAWLFVVNEGRLERRAVEVGIVDQGWQLIEAGLQPGELVVARDVEVLSDGLAVETERLELAP